MNKKRDPFDGIEGTLGDLLDEQERATTEPEADPLVGARGPRQRRQYPTEQRRIKLTLDVDMEPAVKEVLARLADEPPEEYGPGPIRLGDLGAAALIIGLVQIAQGRAALEAEWTARSRGRRAVVLLDELDETWDSLVQALQMARFL